MFKIPPGLTCLTLEWKPGCQADDGGCCCVGTAGRIAGQAKSRSAAGCELSAAETVTGRGGGPAPDRGGTAP